MTKTASKFVEQARAWLGVKEGSKTHKEILSIYNSHKPLAHGYEMKTSDAWCAAFVSAVSIKCGFTSIIPTDCRCSSLISKFQKLGVWNEDENRTPKVGDIVFYDWEDKGDGNNRGIPNHVGIVSTVNGAAFTVIEGNKDNRVSTRTMNVNGKYLRGFASPDYDSEASEPEALSSYYIYKIQKGDTLSRIARYTGVPIAEIMDANPAINNPNRIFAGDEIRIPVKE